MELDERKRRVLSIIADLYTKTGEPVGSKVVALYLDSAYSPATIRNDMAALFDLGLLEQHAFFRIEPGRHPVLDQFRHKALDAFGVGVFRGQGVPIGHEKVAFVAVLQVDPVFKHAEVVAQMQGSGWAHAGDDAFVFLGSVLTHNRSSLTSSGG